jgi:hypothetical protein
MHVLLVDGLHQWQAVHVKCGKSIIMPGIPGWASESQPYCGEESSWIEYHITAFYAHDNSQYLIGVSDPKTPRSSVKIEQKLMELAIERSDPQPVIFQSLEARRIAATNYVASNARSIWGG